jgi:hypothetical protein
MSQTKGMLVTHPWSLTFFGQRHDKVDQLPIGNQPFHHCSNAKPCEPRSQMLKFEITASSPEWVGRQDLQIFYNTVRAERSFVPGGVRYASANTQVTNSEGISSLKREREKSSSRLAFKEKFSTVDRNKHQRQADVQ